MFHRHAHGEELLASLLQRQRKWLTGRRLAMGWEIASPGGRVSALHREGPRVARVGFTRRRSRFHRNDGRVIGLPSKPSGHLDVGPAQPSHPAIPHLPGVQDRRFGTHLATDSRQARLGG